MKTKTILGVSLAAAFAVTMIFSQNASAGAVLGFQTIDDVDINKNNPANTIDVTFDTGGTIPENGDFGAFGYGLITGATGHGPENVLALTTHLCVSDSPVQSDADDPRCNAIIQNGQNPGLLDALGFGPGANEAHEGPEFHAHILDLKAIVDTSSCSQVANVFAEVDLQRTLQTQNNVSPDWLVEVDDDEITVYDVPRGDLHSSAFKKAGTAVFGIAPFWDTNDPELTITNLCLTELPAP